MKIKQLNADKKESLILEVELESGLTVGLSDYLRALQLNIERLTERVAALESAGGAAAKDHDIPDQG